MRGMIKSVNRFGVFVPSLEAAKEFYTGIGFELEHEAKIEAAGIRFAFVRMGAVRLELIEKLEGANVPFHQDGVINNITFDVDDIEATMEDLSARGVQFFGRVADLPTVKIVFGKGPNGEIIELVENKG